MDAEQIRMQPFIDCTRSSGFSYFRISKSMLQLGHAQGIETDEVLLYTLLRDRARLSYENGNYDGDGRLYVFCTRPNAAAYFGWSLRKTVRLFHALAEHRLIEEQPSFDSRGKQKATRIYLNAWSVPNLVFSQEDFERLRFPALTVDSLLTMDIGEYYILPKTLLEAERYHGLSLRAMLLYMLLLDRISLSRRYGRMDSNGLLWTTMDADLISRELGCSPRSLSRAAAELENIALIERRAVSYAEKWRIYVRDFLPIAPELQLSPTPQIPETEDASDLFSDAGDRSFSFDAKSASLCRQSCTPVPPDLHPCAAKAAPPVSPNLHPIKLSLINHSEKKPSQTTSIPAAPSIGLPEDRDAGMSVFEKKKAKALRSMELQCRSMELCHYGETAELCCTRLSETEADQGLEILDFTVDVIRDALASPLPCQTLGRESVSSADLTARLEELDAYSTFLVIEKVLPRWDRIRDKTAYLRRTLYLASRQHRQEAFFLRRQVENEFLDGYRFALPV